MSIAKIRSALVAAYQAGAFFSDANTAYENVKFTPPNATPWCRFTFVPAQPDVATLGDAGDDEVNGFVQLDINFPINTGSNAADTKADAIRNVFQAGSRFVYQIQEVVTRSCGRSQGSVVDGFYRINITIPFYAYVNR